jgi:hypothetical protein
MDALTLFGLSAVTAMLICYALEDRNRSDWIATYPTARLDLGQRIFQQPCSGNQASTAFTRGVPRSQKAEPTNHGSL